MGITFKRRYINPADPVTELVRFNSQYHSYWCPGSLRRQSITTHDIDYVE